MTFTTKFACPFLAGALALLPFSALAANACYTPAQMQAEHLLRLHSELMVITVTCAKGSGGEDLPAAYGDFTKKNIHVLHEAEQTMIAYYREHAKGDPLEHLDRLRTILANEFGQRSANMSAPVFCGTYRDKVVQMDAASPADVQNEVERMQISERSYANACNAKGTVVAKKVN
jgi:hypothetical protein